MERGTTPNFWLEPWTSLMGGGPLRRVRVRTDEGSWEWELPTEDMRAAEWLRDSIEHAAHEAGAGPRPSLG